MLELSTLSSPLPTTLAPAGAMTPSKELADVESLGAELKRLLVSHEDVLAEEGVDAEMRILERWVESYRRGLSAAQKISEKGLAWLAALSNHLKLASEELQRLEGEGGNPLSREQMEKTEQLRATLKRIDALWPELQQIFAKPEITSQN